MHSCRCSTNLAGGLKNMEDRRWVIVGTPYVLDISATNAVPYYLIEVSNPSPQC